MTPLRRIRQGISCLLAVTVVGCVALAWARTSPTADVKIRITDYVVTNDVLAVSAVATNQGRSILHYEGCPPFADILWETGSNSNLTTPKAVSKSCFGFIRPAQSITYRFSIPSSARSIQVLGYFSVVGPRGRLWLLLSQKPWGSWSCRVLEKVQEMVPESSKPYELWSEKVILRPTAR
jgi:hypothetical protein